jgi:hypothetical protein
LSFIHHHFVVRDAGSKDSRGASDEEQLNEIEEEISQV